MRESMSKPALCREELLPRLMLRLIPAEGREELTEKVPHDRLLDLALVCRVDLREDMCGGPVVSALLTEDMAAVLGMPAREIFELAKISSHDKEPARIRYMDDVIGELTGEDDGSGDPNGSNRGAEGTVDVPEGEQTSRARMLVLTNSSGLFGASVITYPGILEEAAGMLDADLLILPSSVHELIALPDEGFLEIPELREMVRSINEAIVPPEDRLSDHVYRYRRGSAAPEFA